MMSVEHRRLRRLANALSAEDLRLLAIEVGMRDAYSRQLPGLVDVLVTDHQKALLGRLELRISEAAKTATE